MRKKLQKLTAIILSLAITVSVLAVAPFYGRRIRKH